MASVTQSNVAVPLRSGTCATVRIEPPRGLFELRLDEVWAYRELLYFFVWRDVKIRYKQTAIGVLRARGLCHRLRRSLRFCFRLRHPPHACRPLAPGSSASRSIYGAWRRLVDVRAERTL